MTEVLVTTTPTIEGKKIVAYQGLVTATGESDSGAWSKAMEEARDKLADIVEGLGSNAVVGASVGYEMCTTPIAGKEFYTFVLATISGTAVTVE